MKNRFDSGSEVRKVQNGDVSRPGAPRLRRRQHRGRGGNYSGFVRVPGLFRMWEIQDLVTDQSDLQVEPSGATDDGTPVYVVFRREGRRT